MGGNGGEGMKLRNPDGQEFEFGVKECYEHLIELTASTAESYNLKSKHLQRTFPQLAWSFWLEINPQNTDLYINDIIDGSHGFNIKYQILFFDDGWSEGEFIWFPTQGNKPLIELFQEIREHYS